MIAPVSDSTGVTIKSSLIWRIGFIGLAVVAIGLFLRFVIEDGGGVFFTVLMAWFFSMAMAPAVDRLMSRTGMRRGVATGIVMACVGLFVVLFFLAFGRLLADQLAEIIRSLPDLFARVVDWFNTTFGTSYDPAALLAQIDFTDSRLQNFATEVAVGILGVATSVLASIFSVFTFGLLAFYLCADGPRLRRWVASLFPVHAQRVFIDVWDITADKTGRYVAARVVLAAINGGSSGIVFAIIGLPYWLPLAIWTGVVAQFVPTIGTYISIVLPVIVGLLSGNPWLGVIVLVWALIYQQIENLTIEPRISARAVNVHPAFAFASVLLGAALFGVAGALLAIPVSAMILAMVGIYVKRHQLIEDLQDDDSGSASREASAG